MRQQSMARQSDSELSNHHQGQAADDFYDDIWFHDFRNRNVYSVEKVKDVSSIEKSAVVCSIGQAMEVSLIEKFRV